MWPFTSEAVLLMHMCVPQGHESSGLGGGSEVLRGAPSGSSSDPSKAFSCLQPNLVFHSFNYLDELLEP